MLNRVYYSAHVCLPFTGENIVLLPDHLAMKSDVEIKGKSEACVATVSGILLPSLKFSFWTLGHYIDR